MSRVTLAAAGRRAARAGVAVVLALAGCAGPGVPSPPAARAPDAAATLGGEHPRVALETTAGTIVLELDRHAAPVTVTNFVQYVSDHFYDGLIFHRVIPGFVIQGGGFDAQLHEHEGRAPIKNEATNGLHNGVGTIAMARTSELDSATSEFFINVADNGFLDHHTIPPEGLTLVRRGRTVHYQPGEEDKVYGYAVFGHVVSGMDVVRAIEKGPTTTRGEMDDVPVQPVVVTRAVILQ